MIKFIIQVTRTFGPTKLFGTRIDRQIKLVGGVYSVLVTLAWHKDFRGSPELLPPHQTSPGDLDGSAATGYVKFGIFGTFSLPTELLKSLITVLRTSSFCHYDMNSRWGPHCLRGARRLLNSL